MLKRKIENDINNWIKNSNKALLIYGARQVGKTFIIRKCLEESKCDFIEINLIDQPSIVKALETFLDVDDLIMRLSLLTGYNVLKNKTILFIDEVQVYKEAITKIKYLVNNELKIIMSGSLLGVEINNLSSAPVGYLESLTMYPLDFEEFLQIFDVQDKLISFLRNCFANKTKVSEEINERMIYLYRRYLVIGGMPDAVQTFLTSNSLEEVDKIHKDISNQYGIDFTKYEKEDKRLLLKDIYEIIPSELYKKRFFVQDINKNKRYERVENNFLWLSDSGVAIPCYSITDPVIPLKLSETRSFLKLFLNDVGMLTSLYGNALKAAIINEDDSANLGPVYENFVAQELKCHGFNLNYYNSKKNGEVDFVVEYNNKILPIEVKSGTNFKTHLSLNKLLDCKNYNIDNAYVLSNCNIEVTDKIIYYPIYMIMFLKPSDISIKKLEKVSFEDIKIS